MSSLSVRNFHADIDLFPVQRKVRLRDGLSRPGRCPVAVSSHGLQENLIRRRTFHMHMAARAGEFQNLRSLSLSVRHTAAVKASLLQRVDDSVIGKALCADHDISAEGVIQAAVDGHAVVIVVCGYAEKLLAASEHLIVGLGMVAVQTVHLTAVVIDFHAPHSLQLRILVTGLQGPVRMIVAAEKAQLRHLFHIGVHRVHVLIRHLRPPESFLDLLILIRAGIVPVHVPGTAVVPEHISCLVHVRFQRSDGDKILITQLSVITIMVVIRDGEHLIAFFLIMLLYLLRRHFPVGKYGVAVKICLIVSDSLRQQFHGFHIYLHSNASQIRNFFHSDLYI